MSIARRIPTTRRLSQDAKPWVLLGTAILLVCAGMLAGGLLAMLSV